MSAPPRPLRSMRVQGLPGRQRGMALLVAILLVALGTILAATIAYENAMTARRGAATFAFDETLVISEGAEALAAYGLRAVKKADPTTTNLTQAWAQPVGPLEIVPDVMLDATLEDVQGRFNINSLVKDDGSGMPDPVAQAAFINLLQIVGLEPKWADFVIDWIDPSFTTSTPDGAEDSVYMGQNPPYVMPHKYITSTTELLALPEFGRDRYMKLAPYITALPPGVKVNICTAPGAVLDAFMTGRREFSADPDALAKNRAGAPGCFPTASEYQAAFDSPDNYTKAQAQFAQTSNYFRLTSHITIGSAEFNLYSLLYREDSDGTVRPIQRSFSPD